MYEGSHAAVDRPMSQNHVAENAQLLDERLARLTDTVERLQNRLNPVAIYNPRPSVFEEKDSEPIGSLHAQWLLLMANKLLVSNDRLEYILESLDI